MSDIYDIFDQDLSQNAALEPHTSRDIYKEEPCTSAKRTTGARGSEDTPGTPTTAPAGGASMGTEVGDTSTTRTERAGTATSGSSAPSGKSGSGNRCPDENDACDGTDLLHGEWCLRTDGASAPLPCSYTKGHEGPCYFRW